MTRGIPLSRALDNAACHPLRSESARRCAQLHAESFASPWSEGEIARLTTEDNVIGDGVDVGPKNLVGFILSRYVEDEGEILTIAIDPVYRNRRLGAALLAAHLARLATRGVSTLFLEVDENNTPALMLYKRYGFEKVGRRPAYYARADGGQAAAAIMRAHL